MDFAYMSPLQSHFSAQPPVRQQDGQVDRQTSAQVPEDSQLVARLNDEAEAEFRLLEETDDNPSMVPPAARDLQDTTASTSKAAATTAEQQDKAAVIPGAAKELVVDDRRLPQPLHQHFVFDETSEAERDPHLASVRKASETAGVAPKLWPRGCSRRA
jgi:hypothetical protein